MIGNGKLLSSGPPVRLKERVACDTFDVQGFGLVSLSQVDYPEMGTIEAVHAREFAMEWLLNVVVFLDKDDLVGTNADGSIPCLVSLSKSEFDPANW